MFSVRAFLHICSHCGNILVEAFPVFIAHCVEVRKEEIQMGR
jgi:hypothetical protein